MPAPKVRAACRSLMNARAGIDIENLDWSELLSFDTTKSLANATWLCEQVARDHGSFATPSAEADRLAVLIEDTAGKLTHLGSLSFSSNHSRSEIDSAQAQFCESVDKLVPALGPWAAVHALQNGEAVQELRQERRKLEEASKKASDLANQAKTIAEKDLVEHRETVKTIVEDAAGAKDDATTAAGEARAAKKEAEEVTDELRSMSAKVGVGLFVESFETEANGARKRGYLWMSVLTVLLLATIATAFNIGLETPPTPASAQENQWTESWKWFYALTTKILVLSMMVYAVTWSSRMCLANFHLSSVNRHRALSIRSLEAFRGAAANNASKDAVTLEAARAVYGHVPTGYLGKVEAGAGGVLPTRILERITEKGGE